MYATPPTTVLSILVVDDDQIIATTTSMVLQASGFNSVPAFSAEDALAHAQSSYFDILLTDVMMEPTNGIQLAIAFRAIHPSADVILFSGNDQAADLLRDAANYGHNFPILAKPVNPDDLIDRLRSIRGRDSRNSKDQL
jgi:DNA-binding response OmpR family regulator